MAALPRESAFLPTIKCSTCGRAIEISMMGDHICSERDAEVPPLPPKDITPSSYENPVYDKYDRRLPGVDTNAANGTYTRQDQLTPVSTSSGSRSLSPRTPDGRSVGGRGTEYFEPTIAGEYDAMSPQQGGRLGGYGGFSERTDFDAELYPSTSPKQPSLLRRMDTIAPGPFDIDRRKNGSSRNAFPPRDNRGSDNSREGYGTDRPSTASNRSGSDASGYAEVAPRKDGYGGFGGQRRQDDFEPRPFGSPMRSGTFPKPSEPTEAPMRTPSAPGARPNRFRSDSSERPSYKRDTSRPPPPRKSLVRPRTAGRDAASSINLAAEFGIQNPYHSHTESMSSAISSYSQETSSGQSRGRSSPSRSDGRKPSDTSNIDDLMNDLQASMDQMQPLTPQLNTNPSVVSSRRGRSRDGRSASRSRSASRGGRQPMNRYDEPSFNYKAELDRYNASTRDQQDSRREPDWRAGGRRPSDEDERNKDLYRSASGSRPNDYSRGALPPSRGVCKACGLDIRGKSISSADGRLTGKYHKACFVCTTCKEPFTSSEFYVLNDKPYCELHYHELNGSLCGACGKGIEGQYLEDEDLVKYHVGCFRCADCGMSLSNGYFDVDGKSYCERDAWRRVQQAPSMGSASPDLASPSSEYSPGLAGFLSPMTPAFDRKFQSPVPPSPAPSRGPSAGPPAGLPQRPMNMGGAAPPRRPPVGLPRGQRMAPGMGPVPRPRMNKRNTRLGMM